MLALWVLHVTLLQYGYLLPRQPLDYNSVWDCTDCDSTQQNQDIANKLSKYEEDIETMEKDKVVHLSSDDRNKYFLPT